ncbi:GAF domain-containing protein [Propionibacteriaceae bacterium Y1923]|uniref:GAF domain-containing sensor histidine kinase n=1 Tax=Aestuariimicrobium sp. Y1814 TaxID=3418742 RepID=UPI003C1646DD
MGHSLAGVVRWHPDALADELAEPLHNLRLGQFASDAVVVFAPHRQPPRVVAWDSPLAPLFTVDEPVELNVRWPRRPASCREVSIASTMRPVTLDFDSAVVIPFTTDTGRGLVLFGSSPHPDEAAAGQVQEFSRQLDDLRRELGATRHADVDRAYRTVARAASSELAPDQVFDVTLAAARLLVGAEVAYLGLPVDDENFYFHRSLGIRTRDFLDLRVAWGEGLGGAARALERPVRSLSYRDDTNLHRAPVQETLAEGIVSALAVPVRDRGPVEAVLYVASRRPRAYSEDDERILADFASATHLGLDRADLETARTARIREQERARIARSLHDDLIRRLTSIGFAADSLQERVGDDLAGQVAAITEDLGAAMALVRGELRDLVAHNDDHDQGLDEVAERILAVPSLGSMTRATSFAGPLVADQARVSPEVAEAMTRVGQEAVFNSETHSGGTRCSVSFDIAAHRCTMSITDDGSGQLDHPREGHYGMDLIRREVQRVGGTVSFEAGPTGGFEVHANFPLAAGTRP